MSSLFVQRRLKPTSWYTILTGSAPLSKWVLQTVRCTAFFFNFQYLLVPLRSSSSCLRLLPRLPVTSILLYIFPSIMCFIRQFLFKMWPIQLTSFFIVRRICLLSWAPRSTSPFLTRLVQLILSVLLQHYMSKLSRYFWSTFRRVSN